MLALNFTGCIPYIIRSGFVISSYTMPSNKNFVDFYFKEHPELEHVWVCRCGMSRKQNRKLRGHGNLMEHITRHHKNYLSEFRDGSKLAAVFQNVSDKARNIHAWLDWTCTGLPFSFCEKDSTKKYTSLSPICSKTLVTYTNMVVEKVEIEISEILPAKNFGLIIDGWSDMGTSTHYSGIFAAVQNKGKNLQTPMLSFSPLSNECSQSADSHIEFITFVLESYKRKITDLGFIICDNENLNKAIARKIGVPMFGCPSHRLNLAVKTIPKFGAEIEMINKLMVKLSTLKQSAILRTKTKLRPVLRNVTRWSSSLNEFARAIVVSCLGEKLTFSQDEIIKKYIFCSEEEEPMECCSSDGFATQVLSQGTTSAKTCLPLQI